MLKGKRTMKETIHRGCGCVYYFEDGAVVPDGYLCETHQIAYSVSVAKEELRKLNKYAKVKSKLPKIYDLLDSFKCEQ